VQCSPEQRDRDGGGGQRRRVLLHRRRDGARARPHRGREPHRGTCRDRGATATDHDLQMKQRDALIVLGAVMLAVAVSAILLAASLGTVASAERRIFFDARNSPPPARSVGEAQRGLPGALQPIVPVQRGLTDTARDAAGYLLTLLAFAAASWRLGDVLFQLRGLRRYAGRVPAPLIALLGATFIYISWQIPYLGAPAVIGALAYALGAVLTARLTHATRSQTAT